MKYKILIPTIAICMGSSLLVGSVRADDKDTTVTTYVGLIAFVANVLTAVVVNVAIASAQGRRAEQL